MCKMFFVLFPYCHAHKYNTNLLHVIWNSYQPLSSTNRPLKTLILSIILARESTCIRVPTLWDKDKIIHRMLYCKWIYSCYYIMIKAGSHQHSHKMANMSFSFFSPNQIQDVLLSLSKLHFFPSLEKYFQFQDFSRQQLLHLEVQSSLHPLRWPVWPGEYTTHQC